MDDNITRVANDILLTTYLIAHPGHLTDYPIPYNYMISLKSG